MARLVTAGFETGSLGELNGGSNGVQISSVAARTGTYSIVFGSGGGFNGSYHSEVFDADRTTIFGRVAFRFTADYLTYLGANRGVILTFFDALGVEHMTLEFSPNTQSFILKRGDTTTGVEIAYGTIVIQSSTWYVLEWKLKVDPSAGEFIWKINSVTDFSFTGNTQGGTNGCRRVRFSSHLGLMTYADYVYMDDIGINDDAGSDQQTWLGLGGVYVLKPNGEGYLQEFTPSAGTTHYDKVDDIPRNTTDWVQSVAAGNKEMFAVEDTPAYITEINLVQVLYQAAVVASGEQTVYDIVRQGTVDYQGGSVVVVPVVPGYLLYRGTVWYDQPNGSGAWSSATVSDIEIGLEVAA
jgi:hypothetical protein